MSPAPFPPGGPGHAFFQGKRRRGEHGRGKKKKGKRPGLPPPGSAPQKGQKKPRRGDRWLEGAQEGKRRNMPGQQSPVACGRATPEKRQGAVAYNMPESINKDGISGAPCVQKPGAPPAGAGLLSREAPEGEHGREKRPEQGGRRKGEERKAPGPAATGERPAEGTKKPRRGGARGGKAPPFYGKKP